MNDKLAGQYYLDRDKYLVQRQGWLQEEAWVILVNEWCSEEWIAKSKKHHDNRVSSKFNDLLTGKPKNSFIFIATLVLLTFKKMNSNMDVIGTNM